MGSDQLSITHKLCGKTSFNTNDIAKKYCAHCHIFMAVGTFTINEPEVKTMPIGQSFFVTGLVAARDKMPYVQLHNAETLIAQLTMSQARQIATDILVMCARTEADAMIHRFFERNEFPPEAGAAIMQMFRDFRYELDEDKAERT